MLGRDATPKEVEDFLTEVNSGTGTSIFGEPSLGDSIFGDDADTYKKVDQSLVDNAISKLKLTLEREPTPKEVEDYLQANSPTKEGNWTQVDQSKVAAAQRVLKATLAREPTAKEV